MSDRGASVNGRLRRLRDCHFDCYVDLASAAEQPSDDDEWFEAGTEWFQVLDSEIANIRSALEWGLTNERPETAAFAASLSWYWKKSRKFAEGRQVLDRALRHPSLPVASRVDALYAAAALAWDQREPDGARARYEAARRLAASAGDRRRQARAAIGLGWACFHVSLADPAIEAFGEARDLSDHLSVADQAYALRGLGWAKRLKGDKDAAIEAHRDARRLLEEVGDRDLTTHYLVETEFLIQMGYPDQALVLADKAVVLARAGEGRLIYALIAREKAADALGDLELLRGAIDEGIQFTQAAGEAKWEAHFQRRLADYAMLRGEIETARGALDRGLLVLEQFQDLNLSDLGIRADLLTRRAQLAEDDGDLDIAEELQRQVVLSHAGSSPRSNAMALGGLARLLKEHGDPDRARLALVQAVAVVDGSDGFSSSDMRMTLAIHDEDFEEALRILSEGLNLDGQRGYQALPVAHRYRAALLAELGRLDESAAVLDEAVVAVGATSEAADRARSYVDRARVRIALGDADGARSDLLETAGVASTGWASDQLRFATALARLALLEGRGDRAAELWTAVAQYRTSTRRLPPPLSRWFEAPLAELPATPSKPAPAPRAGLDALRALVSDEFDSLAPGRGG